MESVLVVIAAFIQIKTHGNLDVDAVLDAPGDELIQIAQLVFVDQASVFRIVRKTKGGKAQKDAGKIKSVVGKEFDVRFPEIGAFRTAAVVFAAAETGALPFGGQLRLSHFR